MVASIAYAGFRAAKHARDRYSKLLAAGITGLVLCQATLNMFAVMGLALGRMVRLMADVGVEYRFGELRAPVP